MADRTGWQRRVACVYQHSKIVPTITVAENLHLGRFERPLISWRAMRRGGGRLLHEWGFELDVDLLASELSVEQRQIVEIARALSIGARFLILDEPTAALEARGIERLFGRVNRLKESGVGVMYISHHIEEIYKICDRVTVLRDGKHVITGEVAELDQDAVVRAMVGTAVVPVTSPTAAATGRRRLRSRGPARARIDRADERERKLDAIDHAAALALRLPLDQASKPGSTRADRAAAGDSQRRRAAGQRAQWRQPAEGRRRASARGPPGAARTPQSHDGRRRRLEGGAATHRGRRAWRWRRGPARIGRPRGAARRNEARDHGARSHRA